MDLARPPRLLAGLIIAVAFATGILVTTQLVRSDSSALEATLNETQRDVEAATLYATGTTMPARDSTITGSAASPEDSAAPRLLSQDQSQNQNQRSIAGDTARYETIRNTDPKFSQYAGLSAEEIGLDLLLEGADRPDNGSNGDGQFRVACEYSHFGADDPIIFPGQPGAAHLHMFFGNTAVDAFTTEESLLNTGGGTCSGFELNRSGYWVPALLDGRGNAVVPEQIILYYKTKRPNEVVELPQGLQMLAGNIDRESFEVSNMLHWSCGKNGFGYNKTNRIPDCGGDVINASVVFPNCWDGVNLSSDDFVSHLKSVDVEVACPSSHPKRLPQISILIYWPGQDSVDGWSLSSDATGSFNGPPGGTLHADWWGGWNDDAMSLWINGCMKAARNCSYGQTGTSRQLARLSRLNTYEGEHVLALP